MRCVVLLLAAGLVWTSVASAHAPGTAIGRAVTALRAGNVSYDPASPLSEIDAGAIERQLPAGEDVAVALMPSRALGEVTGGPDRIAREVAAEAARTGTVIVVAGTRVGAWSGEIAAPRLGELVRTADAAGAAPAQTVVELASRVASEGQTRDESGSGSGVWVIATTAAAFAAVAAGAIMLRRRTRP